MIIDRRVFVAGAALAVVAPALRMLPAEAAVPELAAIEQPALMISGWSEEVGGVDNQIWLRVGLGWRTAWR
jgi:hypothetical protein